MKKFPAATFAIILFSVAVFAQEQIKSYTKIGDAMPDFSVKETGGKEFKISALRGKIVYVNFWATWCPPCVEEMPRIEKEIWQPNKDSENFAMVGIAREQKEKEITPFVEKYNYTFPVAADTTRSVYNLFGDAGIPRSYVVGADGKILFQLIGYNAKEFDRMKKIISDELGKLKNKN